MSAVSAAGTDGAAPRSVRRALSGWGRYPVVETDAYRPERIARLGGLVAGSDPILARGLGRSYGDAALNGAGRTVLFERLNRFVAFDPETGVLRCEAGVTIADIIEVFGPHGFLPAVCPGTRYVTVGGAIACDIHGKNHHRDGSFGRHVLGLRLITATGEPVDCGPDEDPDLFRATVGGMGLTGLIAEATMRLRRVPGPTLAVDYDRAPDLDAALRMFEETDARYAYSMAWIDCLARGSALGRSVLMRGDPVPEERPPLLPAGRLRRGSGLRGHGRSPRLRMPFDLPAWVLNPVTMRAFNALYYRRHPVRRHGVITDYDSFFFPLDRIGDWNRVYGKRGFLQYQCVVPEHTGRAALVRLLELARQGHGSFLAVLKRFGEEDGAGPLAFPRPGYTLALDFPASGDQLLRLLDAMDDVVAEAGGRLYLAKDARMRPDFFRATYPDVPAWLAVKRRIDPENRFASDLSRRLGLTP
jgi:decaprenylphospho-beta-D-ribofuranose 2-oxidase